MSRSDDRRAADPPIAQDVSFREALGVWWKIGLLSFGGPAGQIALMHRILVEEKRWISEHRFLHALNYCMVLPGPEAQQLATYLGWLLHGHRGGLVAGSLFILPGFAAILALSILYATYRDVSTITAVFFGLKAAVLAIVVEAVLRIGKRVLKNAVMVAIAAAAFLALFAFGVAFPVVVLAAGSVGLLGGWLDPARFVVIRPKDLSARDRAVVDEILERNPSRIRTSWNRAARTVAVCALLWLLPLAVLGRWLGPSHVFTQEAVFFGKAAMVTFGGAYAVLAYVAQEAVERYQWLAAGEMLDGLGLAETTPGPLILVVQFVGFLGAYRNPGALDPWLAGTLGAVLTIWVTFVPCFLWIFAGAPFVERTRENPKLSAALSTITAAVVGVVLNLAVWFSVHVVFRETVEVAGPAGTRWTAPVVASVDLAALAIAALAFLALLRWKVGLASVLAGAAVCGIAVQMFAR